MHTVNKRVAIAIPIYKETITDLEKISLLQGIKKLHSYEIFFVRPRSLSESNYRSIASEAKFIEFEDRFFRSIDGYNELMISPGFYRAFLAFEYVLIYQLDAFVFGESLEDWCKEKIDYVGAPWVNNPAVEKFCADLNRSRFGILRAIKKRVNFSSNNPPVVGNGGLSLRKVHKFYRLSLFLKPILKMLGYRWNEDLVWSVFVPKYYPWFKVAGFRAALRFSIEAHPEQGILQLEGARPFGIHAWYITPDVLRYWRPYIEREGYLLTNSDI